MSDVFGFSVLIDKSVFSRTGLLINNGLNRFWKNHTINAAKNYMKKHPEFKLIIN